MIFYQKVGEVVLLKLALSVTDVDEVEIVSDKVVEAQDNQGTT